jgi:predicted nucleotide-binding protein (sugar kinase/HSP70/actin superfamily)
MKRKNKMAKLKYDKKTGRLLFTKKMRKEYTILFPMMMETHFRILQPCFNACGYHAELLTTTGPEIAQTGLKYIHNDTCYPAILSCGQLINALQSGKYDTHKVALMITQTGGGCRASNYIHLLRKGLKKAELDYVPVVSMNLSKLEANPGFHITLKMIRRLAAGMIYGDLLMYLKNQTEPYEIKARQTETLVSDWTDKLIGIINKGKGISKKSIASLLNQISDDFSKIKCDRTVKKIKVGIVGEIYVKYAALGNNSLESFLKNEGCEVYLGGLLSFVLFKIDNRLEDIKLYGGSSLKKMVCQILMNYCLKLEKILIASIKKYPQYMPPTEYYDMKKMVKGIIGYGDKMGEGWLLTAEMVELAHNGYKNIVCTQPFGCLPNHIAGKGMIRKVVELTGANIVAVDYDAGAPKVNQENRIKLMLAIAKENLEK